MYSLTDSDRQDHLHEKAKSTKWSLAKSLEGIASLLLDVNDAASCVTLTHYTRQLSLLGLSPYTLLAPQQDVLSMLHKLASYTVCKKPGHCRCNLLKIDEMLRNISDEHIGHVTGLCLLCVKRGKITKEEGNCAYSMSEWCWPGMKPNPCLWSLIFEAKTTG